jgi:hypothetical protein
VVVAGTVGVVVGGGDGAGLVVMVVTGAVVAVVAGGAGAGAGTTVATVAGCRDGRAAAGLRLRLVGATAAGSVVDGDVFAGGRVVVVTPAAVAVGWRSAGDFDAWSPPADVQAESDVANPTSAATHESVHRRRESVHRPTPPDRTPATSTDRRRSPNSQRDRSVPWTTWRTVPTSGERPLVRCRWPGC